MAFRFWKLIACMKTLVKSSTLGAAALETSSLGVAGKFFVGQLACIGFLFAIHLVSQLYAVAVGASLEPGGGSFSMLNMDNEANLPAWYSTCALFLCAVWAAIIAISKTGLRRQSPWLGLAVLFAYLSFDESASLHEGMIPGVLGKFGIGITSSQVDGFNWMPLGMAFFAGVALIYFKFWWRLPSKTRLLFALSAFTFLAGALGFEKISHVYEARYMTESTWQYVVTCGIEEFLEMLGIAIFNYALVSYLLRHVGFIKAEAVSRRENVEAG